MPDLAIAIILGSTRPREQLEVMLDQLESWTAALEGVREDQLGQAA